MNQPPATRLRELTDDQWTDVYKLRDEWIAHGLNTTPADRAAAEEGVRQAYRAAGLEPPRFIIWLDSPWAGVIGQAIAPEIVAAALRRLVGSEVDSKVYSEVDSEVGSAEYKRRLSSWWRGRMWGQFNAGYYAYYDAMERIGVTGLDPIHGQQQVAKNAGWWWCHRDFAILTERPVELHRDADGRLHCETGPAISWPDGWGFYAWHGTRVPADLIEGDGWTPERILAEGNQEIRRCAIERIGWDRFIDQAHLARVGDPKPDPGNPGNQIALYDVPARIYSEPIRVLLCTNGTVERDGTRRRFGLTVPANVSDPIAAAAWTYDWPIEAYRKLARRA